MLWLWLIGLKLAFSNFLWCENARVLAMMIVLSGAGNPNPDKTYVPALRRSRRVLLLVDLDQTKQLLTERGSDDHILPKSPRTPCPEEMELLTYSCLSTPSQMKKKLSW